MKKRKFKVGDLVVCLAATTLLRTPLSSKYDHFLNGNLCRVSSIYTGYNYYDYIVEPLIKGSERVLRVYEDQIVAANEIKNVPNKHFNNVSDILRV